MKGWVDMVGWPTADGLPTKNGHPSAAGRAQDSECSPVNDQRSTTIPRNQLYGNLLLRISVHLIVNIEVVDAAVTFLWSLAPFTSMQTDDGLCMLRMPACGLLQGRKERRRYSVNRSFFGDYINLEAHPQLRRLLNDKREHVEFADVVTKYDRRGKVCYTGLSLYSATSCRQRSQSRWTQRNADPAPPVIDIRRTPYLRFHKNAQGPTSTCREAQMWCTVSSTLIFHFSHWLQRQFWDGAGSPNTGHTFWVLPLLTWRWREDAGVRIAFAPAPRPLPPRGHV